MSWLYSVGSDSATLLLNSVTMTLSDRCLGSILLGLTTLHCYRTVLSCALVMTMQSETDSCLDCILLGLTILHCYRTVLP